MDEIREYLVHIETLIEKLVDEKVEWMAKYYLLRDEQYLPIKAKCEAQEKQIERLQEKLKCL